MTHAPFARTLSHGERVSPKATGEGVRRRRFPLVRCCLTKPLLRKRVGGQEFPVPIKAENRRTHLVAAGHVEQAPDFLDHPVEATAYIVVGKAGLKVAGGFDPFPPRSIRLDLPGMMAPVDFDGDSCRLTDEVDDVPGDRHLTSELPSVQPPVAELLPKQILRRGALGPKTTRCGFGKIRHGGASERCDEDTQDPPRRTPSPGCFAATLSLREWVKETIES